jgi:RimJ/RimL family protein N-acetyltransferase
MRPTSWLGDHPLAMAISFRLVTRDDYPLLLEWHQRPHVEQWWTKRTTIEEIEEHYGPTIDGTEPTDHCMALLDGEPLGMIQTYLVADYPDYAELIDEPEGVAGVDLFIGEEAMLGRGLGTEMIRRFTEQIVFARPETTAATADPDVRNTTSMRAFEKAGFRSVREFVDPADGHVHALVRRDRS